MRVGYCSPFNPMKSGISDFSEELVGALANKAEVVVFSPVELSNKSVTDHCETHRLSKLDDAQIRNSLDVIVYHVGNNLACHEEILNMYFKYPGVLELHDVGLHYLAAEKATKSQDWEAYRRLAKYCHGTKGANIVDAFLRGESGAPWENHPIDMAMSREIVEKAQAVIVHSEYAKQMVLGVRDDVPVACIMLHSVQEELRPDEIKKMCRDKLGLNSDTVIFGCFGFATKPKRIIQTLEAISRYKDLGNQEFTFLIVGEADKNLRLDERIKKLQLEKNIKTTGYTKLEDFSRYMGVCDFCLNLRYPTQGESSGSLHRMLGMGKPVIVTDIGTFADYPDDVVIKVRHDEHEVDDIFRAICKLADNKRERTARGERARRYAEEHCNIEKNAKRYAEFFEQVVNHTWQPDYEDTLIGHLCELNLTEEKYLEHICAECIIHGFE